MRIFNLFNNQRGGGAFEYVSMTLCNSVPVKKERHIGARLDPANNGHYWKSQNNLLLSLAQPLLILFPNPRKSQYSFSRALHSNHQICHTKSPAPILIQPWHLSYNLGQLGSGLLVSRVIQFSLNSGHKPTREMLETTCYKRTNQGPICAPISLNSFSVLNRIDCLGWGEIATWQ